MLIWSNVYISTPPHPQKVLALSSGYFKPFQNFLLPVFTVINAAVYMIPQKLALTHKPINFNHFANPMYFN